MTVMRCDQHASAADHPTSVHPLASSDTANACIPQFLWLRAKPQCESQHEHCALHRSHVGSTSCTIFFVQLLQPLVFAPSSPSRPMVRANFLAAASASNPSEAELLAMVTGFPLPSHHPHDHHLIAFGSSRRISHSKEHRVRRISHSKEHRVRTPHCKNTAQVQLGVR